MKKIQLLQFSAKRLALICLFGLFGGTVFSQIDSVSVNIHFETGVDPFDSLQTTDVLHVDASIYDIDFMGEVITVVYDYPSNYPVVMIKKSMQEFIDENLKSGDTVTVKFSGIDPQGSYRIETNVRNYQGANFPVIVTNHNIQ